MKQLSIESEALRLYTHFLDQIKMLVYRLLCEFMKCSLILLFSYRLSWKPQISTTLAYSTYWLIEEFSLAFIYWRARILFENGDLSSKKIILLVLTQFLFEKRQRMLSLFFFELNRATGFALYLLTTVWLIGLL